MPQTSRLKRGCVIAVVIVAAVIALAPIHEIRWSGGFTSAEYRLRFTDAAGTPVSGVTLRVETKAGVVSYLYPINEHLPDSTPTSDADGKMTFHHVSQAPEFGGRDIGCLIGIYYRRDKAPQYVLVFSRGGREVTRVRHDDLRPLGYDNPRVERVWRYPDWPMREMVAHIDRWEERERELFPPNSDGRFEREVGVARHYYLMSPGHPEWRREREKSVKFDVVERTVTLSVP